MNFTIDGISKGLQKLLKYFSGTAIFTFLNAPLLAFPSVLKKLDLYLKDDESAVVKLAGFPSFIFCLSLLNSHKLPEVSE